MPKCDKCSAFFKTEAARQKHASAAPLVCVNCNHQCSGKECLEMHQLHCRRKGLHGVWCNSCKQEYVPRPHTDHYNNRCPNCNVCTKCFIKYPRAQRERHNCFWQPRAAKDDTDETKYWVFDVESMFVPGETQAQYVHVDNASALKLEMRAENKHVVNLIVCRRLFHDDRDEHVFKDLDAFCVFLRSLATAKNKVIFFAHNLKGYDGRILLTHLIEKVGEVPTGMVWNGRKIMAMTVYTYIRFQDSLCHIAASLAQFPAIFGLDETRYKKGFFPYLFNVPEFQQYRGAIPAIKYFEPNMMPRKKRQEFLEWYALQRNTHYDFQAELLAYCRSDVNILAHSLEKYMREGLANNQLNPLECLTIASYALQCYKTNHMPEDQVAFLSPEAQLMARDAFAGGRTDVRKLLRYWSAEEVERGEYGVYQDVQSLYPAVQFYDPMPVGHPTIVKYDDDDQQPSLDTINAVFGFVRCDIAPTRYLHHPVLVEKKDGKLVADLVPKTDYVVTSVELAHALANDYVVTHVYETHHYAQSNTLFRDYVVKFLKMKIEASGLPSHIKTETDWAAFRAEHLRRFSIELERDKMIKNPGRKQLAKLMLNSLWGKFAQRASMVQCKTATDAKDHLDLERRWDRGDIDIMYHHASVPNARNRITTYYMYRENVAADEEDNKKNVAIAAFVTAHARMRLWKEMHKLGERVVYHDTDSVIYEYMPDEYNIPSGKYLGEWEDECGGKPIVAFVSSGPKTYSYKCLEKAVVPTAALVDEWRKQHTEFDVDERTGLARAAKYECKAKGFTLNYLSADKINFEGMRALVLKHKPYLEALAPLFKYDRVRGMATLNTRKLLKWSYNKGEVMDDYMVRPFGYERFKRARL